MANSMFLGLRLLSVPLITLFAMSAHALPVDLVTVQDSNGAIISYHVPGAIPLTDINRLVFNFKNLKWEGYYQKASSLIDTATPPAIYTVTGLPGNSGDEWSTNHAFKHDGEIYLTLTRKIAAGSTPTGATPATGTCCESHLVKQVSGSQTEFIYLSKIVDQSYAQF